MTPAFRSLFFSFRIFDPKTVAKTFVAAVAASFLFSSSTPAAQITILHSFADGTVPNDGAIPSGPLIQAPNGILYGTTVSSALNPDGSGTIFAMPLGGTVGTIYAFTGPFLSPNSPLLFYKNTLIGTTASGGHTKEGTQGGFGTIFSTTLSGQTKFLYEFKTAGLASPAGGLGLGPNGDFYGTTTGSAETDGTIFKLDPTSEQLTVLYDFESPGGARVLLLGHDGNFYGITEGATIFMMTPAGAFTRLYKFSGITSGVGPLVEDASGNFYGATNLNGPNSGGAIFKMTPQYAVTILHNFGPHPDGFGPASPVIGPNGNLYGVTFGGGTKGYGVVFELSTDGSTYTILHNFYDGSVQNDGAAPTTGLVLGSDNNLYGVTPEGGSMGLGVIFEVVP